MPTIFHWFAKRFGLFLLFSSLLAPGCTTVEEPPCPKITIPDTVGDCSNLCDCADQDMQGRVFRVTRLEIDEPEEFASLLNDMWAMDIEANTLNILFVVDDFEPNSVSSFNTISFSAGPAWRSPKEPLVMPPAEGDPPESMVDSYCLLQGLTVQANVKQYHGYQCVFKTIEDTKLHFHSGPKEKPLVCAPATEPQNSINIDNLKMRFGFNQDCTETRSGYIEGCITIANANDICMCLIPGTCGTPQNEGHDPDDLQAYCLDQCGTSWLSFGRTIDAFNLTPKCITTDGQQGYRIQGFIDAVDVTNKFNPVSSNDCTQ